MLLLLLVQLILVPGPLLLLGAGLLIATVLLECGCAALAKTELGLLLGICIYNLTLIRRVFFDEIFVIEWVDFYVNILVLILVFN